MMSRKLIYLSKWHVLRLCILLSSIFALTCALTYVGLAAPRQTSIPAMMSGSSFPGSSNLNISGGAGDVLALTVSNGSNAGLANKYIYTQFSTLHYTFQAGDFIEYDVKLLDNVYGAGGIEIYTTDGSYFRDTAGWVDQNGVSGHPEADISASAYNQWFHRKLTIPAAFIGKTSASWQVVGENNSSSLVYHAQYDNILVTDGNNYPRTGGTIFRDHSQVNNQTTTQSSDASAALTIGSVGGGSGDVLALYVENAGSSANKYAYKQFSTLSYTFQTGDFIEYDVRLLDNVPGSGGIEINQTDGSYLRDTAGWVDQNSVSGSPGADLSSYAYNQWYHRKLAIPASFVGKTSASWMVAGENDTNFTNYRSLYDNIEVTNGSGTVRSGGLAFQDAAQFNWNTLRDTQTQGAIDSLTTFNLNGVPPGNPRVVSHTYPASDVVVADFVVTDAPYSADSTGTNDATAAIQRALTDCYNAGGGTVWMPAGTYKVTGSITVPNHVTLRGDWRNPDVGSGSYGTVVMANVSSGSDTAPGLFRIWGSAGINGLTVYYPNQSITSPISYPYTFEILGAASNTEAALSSTVENVTLLNSYRGISATTNAVHEMHEIRNVRGTVLYQGLTMFNSSDVSKTEIVTFNNAYWANLDASVSATRPARSAIDTWTRANGTGAVFGDLEWDQMLNISLSDYLVGIDVVRGPRITPFLFLSNFDVEQSNIALKIDDFDGRVGLAISNSTFKANVGSNPVAVQINANNGGAVIFNNSTLGGGATTAVQLLGNVMASFHNCTFDNWTGMYGLTANNGTLVVEGSIFSPTLSGSKKGIDLQAGLSSSTLLGNTYSPVGASNLYDNSSSGNVQWQDTGYGFTPSGVASYTPIASIPTPANNNLYNVRVAPYNAKADGTTDDTAAIQSALNAAGTAGGGTVYLPSGIYKIATHLSVPAGVELRGSEAVPHRAMINGPSTGTILSAYEGRATTTPDTATAFITLNGQGAGVQGFSVDYPQQATDSASNIVAYPWTIRGNGSSVYAYNVTFVNTYKGVDFATNHCDNHYINQVNGTALSEGIRLGNSSQGWVEDNLFNITFWGRAYGLPGALDESTGMFPVAGTYTINNLHTYTVTTGAQNEHLLNNFVYSANVGFTFESNANSTFINGGADGGKSNIVVSGTGSTGVTILNMGGCGCGKGGTGLAVSGGTVKVYNVFLVDSYNLAVNVTGGSTVLIGASFEHNFATVSGGNLLLAGALFKDSGTQVTAASGTVVNLWGNVGQGGFNYSFAAGAGGGYSGNIRR